MIAIVAVRAFGLTRALLRYGERLASHDLALRRLARLRESFYGALAPLAPGGLESRSGDLLSRFIADVDTLRDLYLRVVIPGLVSIVVLVGATIAAWAMLPTAGLTVFLSLVLAIVLLPSMSAAAAARAARRQAPERARLTSELVEAIDGASELAMAGRSAERAASLRRSDRRLAGLARGDALASSGATLAGGLLTGAGVMALLLVVIPAVRSGALGGVLAAALVFLLLAAYDSVLPLSAAARALRVCSTAASRLQEIVVRSPAVTDPGSPKRLSRTGGLDVAQLAFRYEPGQPWVLHGLHLRIGPGEHVAVTGASGSGKSTLAELLVRFGDPTEGRITLDGIDLRELARERDPLSRHPLRAGLPRVQHDDPGEPADRRSRRRGGEAPPGPRHGGA